MATYEEFAKLYLSENEESPVEAQNNQSHIASVPSVKSYLSVNEENPIEASNNQSHEAPFPSVNTSITTSSSERPSKKEQKNPFVTTIEPKPKGEKRKAINTNSPIDKRLVKTNRKSPMVAMNGAETDIGCTICKDTIGSIREKRVLVTRTMCGHEFCLKCLIEWWFSVENKRCPICERNIIFGEVGVLPLLESA